MLQRYAVYTTLFVAHLGLAVSDPQMIDIGLGESPQPCPGVDALTTEGCFLDELEELGDLERWKCWVTSSQHCHSSQFVGKGSLCQHSDSGTATRCVEGNWKTEAKGQHARRKRGGWWWWRKDEKKNEPPTIRCPSDIHVYASYGRTTAFVYYKTPSASDDQGKPSVKKIAGPSSGSSFSEGDTLIRYKATDAQGSTRECHFTVKVTVRFCPSLSYFVHGSRKCSGTKSNIYGSTCRHTCTTGYTLKGANTLECVLKSGRAVWKAYCSGCRYAANPDHPYCTPVSCGNPGFLSGGTLQCANGYTYGKSCYIICKPGFRYIGARSITCQSSGKWTQLGSCNDVTPPKFPNGCPPPKTVYSGPLRAAVGLTWVDPVTSDNSGQSVRLSSVPTKGTRRGPGTHRVTLTARDVKGNRASCIFTITVLAKECPRLASPANSVMSCTAGNAEGSVCNVRCNGGYRLQGQASLTCMSTQRWSMATPSCQAVICSTPATVDHGRFSCPNGRQSPAVCSLTCDSGYAIRGQRTIQCGQDGKWSTPAQCQDVEPPVFNVCHGNLKVNAAILGQNTFVNLTLPTATDNSGGVVPVRSNVRLTRAFPPGTTPVTFTATDANGNSNVCRVNVTVTILQCEVPDLQPGSSLTQSLMQASCPDGYVYGARCALSCAQGYRLQGANMVMCMRDESSYPFTMRWVWSGEDAMQPVCKEDFCPPLSPPQNGALSCYLGAFSWDCLMTCEALWDVPSQSDGRFVCPKDTRTWMPSSPMNCVERKAPNTIRMMTDLLYFTGSCNSSVAQLQRKFIEHLNQTGFGESCRQTSNCVAENIEVTCGPVESRRQRNIDTSDQLPPKLGDHSSNMTANVVVVTIHITFPYEEAASSPEEAYKKYLTESRDIASDLKIHAEMNQNDLVLVDTNSHGEPVLRADCPPGTVFKERFPQTRFSCVPK